MKATLLDYGVGNIHSLRKALEAAGAQVVVTERPEDLLEASAVVLPGVGAFGHVAACLAPVREALRDRLRAGVPALTVCIGMQALYEESDEGPGAGLGLLAGRVTRLRHQVLPHIGWNTVTAAESAVFAGVPRTTHFYFVHSFAPSACGEGVIAEADYGGRFAAAVRVHNTWGFQVHPEKSSAAGRRLLRNFVEAR
jgi:imidazole glycerol phosphate synthase glutamine amidotransferase subunit